MQLFHKLLEDRNRSETVERFMLGPYGAFQIAVTDLMAAIGFSAKNR